LSTIVTDAVTALSGNLALLPEGSGVVTIDGLTYPAADGSANQAIVTNGSGVLSFADAGGGKILQVVTAFDDDYASHSNTTIDAPVEIISAAITCAATSSKVLMFGQSSGSTTASNYQMLGSILKRGSTVIGSADNSSWNTGVGEAHSLMNAQNYSKTASWSFHFLDSPSSTAELTYKVFNFAHHHNGTASSNLTFIKNGGGYNYNNKESIQGVTSLTLMEIGA
jgi:hypothetical protein